MMLADEIKESEASDGNAVISVCRILSSAPPVSQSECRSDESVVVPSVRCVGRKNISR